MPIIKRHESFADFVSRQLGSMNALFAVANVNAASITDDYTGGELLKVLPFAAPAFTPVSVRAFIPTNTKRLKKHQNNTDFVAQHFGTVEALFTMAVLNGVSITENAAPGMLLEAKAVNEKVVAYFLQHEYDIVSNSAATIDSAPPVTGGIGYMKIRNVAIPQQNDFITS